MGLIACSMTPRIDQDQAAFILERIDVAKLIARLHAVGVPVLDDERKSLSLDLAVNANPLVICECHVHGSCSCCVIHNKSTAGTIASVIRQRPAGSRSGRLVPDTHWPDRSPACWRFPRA